MLTIHADNIGDLTIIACQGRLVRSEAAFALRNVVMSQMDSHFVVLDFSRLEALEGGGLGMLMFLQRWAYDHNIRLKLFNPRGAVLDKLKRADLLPTFELATPEEFSDMSAMAGSPHWAHSAQSRVHAHD